MILDAPHFAGIGATTPAGALPDLPVGEIDATPFETPVKDFYLTNPIARASAVMARCSAEHLGTRVQAAE